MNKETTVVVPENFTMDLVTGRPVRDTPREQLRQSIARSLITNYGFDIADLAIDFPVRVGDKRRIVDLVAYKRGSEHTADNIERVMICRAHQPGKRSARIRGSEQASSDLKELTAVMLTLPGCNYGLWTNGTDFFYLQRDLEENAHHLEPIGDWPPCGVTKLQRAIQFTFRSTDPEALRLAFRRCHDFIHGNEGMPKDAAFWQFLYLIFCKIHDERQTASARRFWAGPTDQFSLQGRELIRKRIASLFEDVKSHYKSIFRGSEEITISDRALSFIVSEIGKFDLIATPIDVKGIAYQEIVGANLRGDRGQYFTPRPVIKLIIEMISPGLGDRILDPACGTGGFLVSVLDYVLQELRSQSSIADSETVYDRLRVFSQTAVFGCDFDPFLIRASQMNMLMAGDGSTHIYNINSLEFPSGLSGDVIQAQEAIPFGSIDIVITNPPFGSDIPITDPSILVEFQLARRWVRNNDGRFSPTDTLQKSVAPEILFIERCIHWLRPGGRLGIVVPDGILGNPALEYVRQWILEKAWIVASIDLPVEAFIAEAGVSILTSVLILRKKTQLDTRSDHREDYQIFMAVAEKVGYDRRGNRLFKRDNLGREILITKNETITGRNGEVRHVTSYEKIADDDLSAIAAEFHRWTSSNSEKQPHLNNW